MTAQEALKHIQDPFWFVDLTDREREAVGLASRGKNIVDVIAPKLGVAPKTVYKYLNSATEKINDKRIKNFQDLPDLLLTLIEETLR